MAYTRSVQEFRLAVSDDPRVPRVLIEGDSWTDHPLVSNLSWSLHRYLKNSAHLLNISESGDLIYNMAHGKQFKKLQAYLQSKALNFDMLFLSGGGNDILANSNPNYRLSALLQASNSDEPADYIIEEKWEDSLGRIKSSYDKILSMIQSTNPTLLVVTHTYDYVYPRKNGADIIVIPDALGPWIWPAMQKKGITEQATQRSITKHLQNKFRAMLQELTYKYPNFHVIDTLGTLPEHADWGLNIPHWDDEIHPDSKGFNHLVEKKIGPYIKNLLALHSDERGSNYSLSRSSGSSIVYTNPRRRYGSSNRRRFG